jgi:hypothetical protein
MSRAAFALALILALALPFSLQSFAAQVTESREIGGEMPFEIPSLHVRGSVRPVPGRRLYAITIALGDDAIDDEVARFVLMTTSGTYEPIGAGGRADLIMPLDRIPIDKEVGEILPSDAIVSLTRRSAASVTLEAGPRGTVAFLYELPADSSARSLRLPDGRQLLIAP